MKVKDISDNILLAQELVQHLDKNVGTNVVIKLDIMKLLIASLGFSFEMLVFKFDFSIWFMEIIIGNLSASWFSVLFNGSPLGFFQASSGLKRGGFVVPNFIYIGG